MISTLVASVAAGQQGSQRQSHQPSNLTAPEHVGRFTRGESHDFGTATGGVGYRYSAGDSIQLTVYLYERDSSERAKSSRAAIEDEVQLLKRALEIEHSRGQIGAYVIAFTDPDSVRSGTRAIPGWHLGYVYRRNGEVMVSSLLLFAIGDTFIKVRGTVPQSQLSSYDVPGFAHAFVTAQRSR